MSQQYPPQQPNQPYGQQPYGQQPGWGAPHPPNGFPPPPKKNSAGKIIGLGCAGILGLMVVVGVVGAALGSGKDKNDSSGSTDVKPVASAAAESTPPAAAAEPSKAAPAKTEAKPADPKPEEPKKQVVTFKVWGTAPAGALGPIDITYGSDTDTRQGTFKNGKFEATLPLNDDAMFFNVMAQLQGSGDINCSVTVDGHTEKAHAAGGYNICHAQANSGFLGGWD